MTLAPGPLPPIVYHPAYSAPMPPGRRFPMHKYARLAQVPEEEGLVGPEGLHIAEPASFEMLAAVHDPDYERHQAAVGGTLMAARLALRFGLACNTAGGSHNAGPHGGAGFCTFNDASASECICPTVKC